MTIAELKAALTRIDDETMTVLIAVPTETGSCLLPITGIEDVPDLPDQPPVFVLCCCEDDV